MSSWQQVVPDEERMEDVYLDVRAHDKKGWLGWQLHDDKIVLENFETS